MRFGAPSEQRRSKTSGAFALLFLLAACAGPRSAWQDRSPTALTDYRAAFARNGGTRWVDAAQAEDFIALARSRRVLFLGDHHRDEGLHSQQRELLALLYAAGPTTLLLEAVGVEDQGPVDDYLDGHIGMETLVATCRARFSGAWIAGGDVDSEHYRGLLRQARGARVRALGLEPVPRLPLLQRDARIAAQTRAVATARPDALVVVVVGQDHLLGPGRLVERVALPCTIVGAKPSEWLWLAMPVAPQPPLLRTERSVWYFSER